MIRGGEVYKDIQRRVKVAEERLDDVRANLKRVSDALEDNRTSESKDLSQLARIRFNELEGDRVARGLDAADQEVLTLLDQKRVAAEDVEARLFETQRDHEMIDSERAQLRVAVDDAHAREAQALERVQKALDATESYVFQRTRVERAIEQAGGAAAKATQAETDRIEKGKPYETGKLFSYLWKRRYGFPEYRANLVTRFLDKWVAKLCRYDNAHRDYAMLLEIPVRLREHANQLEAAAAEEAQSLGAMEAKAQEEAGVPALREAVEEKEADLQACEETLSGAEDRLASLRQERAKFDADEDEHTLQAIAVLAAHMAREPIASLRADALQSQTPSDDTIVRQIESLRNAREDLFPKLEEYREQQASALDALEKIEEVRRTFRKRSYDSDDSVFEDGPRVGSVLGGLLRGALVVAEVLADMQSNQRFERPKRSSGGWSWGGGSSSGGWGGGGWSGGRSSGGGWSGGSSSSSGGGGFRTGGGF